MAFSIRNPDPGTAGLYSIDYTVGRGCVNMKDDVLLAQICLNITYFLRQDQPYARRYIRSREELGLQELKEDGICGPLTIARIEQLQNDMARKGDQGMGAIPVKVDGRFDVSPEPGVTHLGPRKHVYSFESMNFVLTEHAEDEAAARYKSLPRTAPSPLLAALADHRRYPRRFR